MPPPKPTAAEVSARAARRAREIEVETSRGVEVLAGSIYALAIAPKLAGGQPLKLSISKEGMATIAESSFEAAKAYAPVMAQSIVGRFAAEDAADADARGLEQTPPAG